MRHQPGHIAFLVHIRYFVNDPGGNNVIQKKHLVLRGAVYFAAERKCAVGSCAVGAQKMFFQAFCILQHFCENVIQHIVHIVIVQIKSAPVDLRQLTNFRDRNLGKGFFLQQCQKSVLDRLTGVFCAAVFFSYFCFHFLPPNYFHRPMKYLSEMNNSSDLLIK